MWVSPHWAPNFAARMPRPLGSGRLDRNRAELAARSMEHDFGSMTQKAAGRSGVIGDYGPGPFVSQPPEPMLAANSLDRSNRRL